MYENDGAMPNPMTPGAAPRPRARRFRPRFLPTLAMLVAVAVFVAAGNWQRGRMQAKEALRARHDVQALAPVVPLARIAGTADWPAERFRPVAATGEYDAAHQILVDNRVHAGRPGYHVVTPLAFDGGAVLVNRGWVAAGPDRAVLPSVPPPAGRVVVTGRIALPDAYLELKDGAPAGPLWQNLDPARFARATGVAVLPVVVEATAAPVPDDGLARAWPEPDFGIDKHRMYMLQWYAFALLAAALWIILGARRRKAPQDHD